MHVTEQNHLVALSDKVRQTPIRDAKGTWNASSLLGPPSVEFAPYGRIPSSKRRNDARQGTIDQDPEFIAFLEELTNPIPPRRAIEDEKKDIGDKGEEMKITPLVQFLKAKKAAKGKKIATPGEIRPDIKVPERRNIDSGAREAASTASRKAVPGGKAEITSRETKEAKPAARGSPESPRKPKAILATKGSHSVDPKKALMPSATPPRGPAADRKRERGNVSAAAKILQRDLGLVCNAESRRRAGGLDNIATTRPGDGAGNANTTALKGSGSEPNQGSARPAVSSNLTASTTSTPKRNSAGDKTTSNTSAEVTDSSSAPGSSAGPLAVLKKDTNIIDAPTGPAVNRTPRKAAPPSSRSSRTSPTTPQLSTGQPQKGTGPTQAFLKHANPSQGITEPVLLQAMEAFGAVTKAEIDKKKGFAYVDFAEPEGLQRAIQGSPVKIAEGQVVILERKERATVGSIRGGRADRGGRGGGYGSGTASNRGGGRGGGRGGRGGFAARGGAIAASGGPSSSPQLTGAKMAKTATTTPVAAGESEIPRAGTQDE